MISGRLPRDVVIRVIDRRPPILPVEIHGWGAWSCRLAGGSWRGLVVYEQPGSPRLAAGPQVEARRVASLPDRYGAEREPLRRALTLEVTNTF
ncbi:MAG: hypothetical protein LC808_43225 [Actinobacteria bacterium]|nr:hypothetical protein [Actinomycetota bacterium]